MDRLQRAKTCAVSFACVVALSMTCISGLSCPPAVAETLPPPYDQVRLRMGFMQSIDSLNPFIAYNDPAKVFFGLVYDCLTSVGANLSIEPNLAREWWALPATHSAMYGRPFGSIWQFNLTRNATWTDGVPFTAHDVAYNINLIAHNPDWMWSPLPYAYFIEDASVVDNYTVMISFYDRQTSLPRPVSFAPLLSIPILPKHLLEQLPGPSYIGMNWTGAYPQDLSPGMPIVGTGPFMATSAVMSEWISGDHITLVKNPSYHWVADKGLEVSLNQIEMRFFADSTSMVLALKNTEIDVASFPPTAYDAIRDDINSGGLTLATVSGGMKVNQEFTGLAINMRPSGPNPSRLDSTIRRAMAMATNKSYIVNNSYLGYAEEGSTVISPLNSFWHYEPNASERIINNLTAASDLLEANGYIDVDSDGTRECTLSSPAVQLGYVDVGTELTYEMWVSKEKPEEKDIVQYIKSSWAEIGITVTYIVIEDIVWPLITYPWYQPDMIVSTWASNPDPNQQLFRFANISGNVWNEWGYDDPAYTSNYTLSVSAMDISERRQYVHDCQRILHSDCPMIVLAYAEQNYAWRTYVFGGWGNWVTEPGRSIDNVWSGNPLYFSLGSGPMQIKIWATPNPAKTHQKVVFNLSASSPDEKALRFTIDFGDGKTATTQSPGGTTDAQFVEVTHRYWWPGNYSVTLWVSDGTPHYYGGIVELEFKGFVKVEQGFDAALFAIVGGVFTAAAIAYLVQKGRRRKWQQTKLDQAITTEPPPPPEPPTV